MILCGGLSKRGNETIEGNVDVCVAVRRRLARDIKQVGVSVAKQQKRSFELREVVAERSQSYRMFLAGSQSAEGSPTFP